LLINSQHLFIIHELFFAVIVGVAGGGVDAVYTKRFFYLAPQFQVNFTITALIVA
jgi:hypothetical protein